MIRLVLNLSQEEARACATIVRWIVSTGALARAFRPRWPNRPTTAHLSSEAAGSRVVRMLEDQLRGAGFV